MRRDIEVADQDPSGAIFCDFAIMASKAFHEVEFVSEFRVFVWVRDIAAGGQINIVNLEVANFNRVHARMSFAAELRRFESLYWVPRGDGDAVMTALLAVYAEMGKPDLFERLFRKLRSLALNFLKAENIRLFSGHESFDIWHSEPHRVDVPAHKFQSRICHRRSLRQRCVTRQCARAFGDTRALTRLGMCA